MKSILERRSIRKYTDKPVSIEIIKDLLRAGMCAPSAGNEQPWHFIILNDKEIFKKINAFHPYSHMLTQAQYAIVVCGDLNAEKYEGFWVQDCSAATENILIAAQDMGLGSVWLGIYPIEERTRGVQNLLNLPKNIIPLSILPIGYPDEEKKYTDRYDESRVHIDTW